MQAWYVKTFGAKSRTGGAFPAADLPGVALNFSPSPDPVVGTQGRAIDHIGLEIRNLEDFCKKLEADAIKFNSPYRKVPALGIAIAFFSDPWGTYIELTEGLDQISSPPGIRAVHRVSLGFTPPSDCARPTQGCSGRTNHHPVQRVCLGFKSGSANA
jgi:hypothetical protein